jgi:hypothetical protein
LEKAPTVREIHLREESSVINRNSVFAMNIPLRVNANFKAGKTGRSA